MKANACVRSKSREYSFARKTRIQLSLRFSVPHTHAHTHSFIKMGKLYVKFSRVVYIDRE